MKGWILPAGGTIAPFGESPAESWLHDHRLGDELRAVMGDVGLELTEVPPDGVVEGPGVVVADNLYVSRRALGELLEGAPRLGEPAVLAMATSKLPARPLQDLEVEQSSGLTRFDCFYLPPGRHELPTAGGYSALRAALGPSSRAVEVRGRPWRLRIAPGGTEGAGAAMEAVVRDAVAMQIRHWVHIHRANLAAIGVRLVDEVRGNRGWAWRAALMSLSTNRAAFRAKLRRRLVRISPGCQIDPDARVESSFIGRGVKIGAGCVIKHSVIGDGCIIGDDSHLIGSVLGSRCTVLHKTWMMACVSYPGSTLSNNKVQLSLFGRGVTLTHASLLFDLVADGEVRVEDQGEMKGLGTRFCGSVLGHRVFVGAGIQIRPGRAIPNDYRLVGRPGDTLIKAPGDLPAGEPLVVRGGTLVPLALAAQESPGDD